MSKIMVSMPDEILKKIDDAASAEHRSRSELLREAARFYIVSLPKKERRPIDNPQVKKAAEMIDRIAGKDTGRFDATTFIRKMRENRQ
ncbi:MAG: ribbon-helix-helix protein, CopG family [bacterium]